MRALAKVCKAVTTIAMVAVVALAAALLLPRAFGITPYAVLSGSMEPDYPVGSLIYTAPVDPADVSEGDVITFRLESGTLVTHKVYAVDAEAEEFTTYGIANVNPDGTQSIDGAPVAWDDVVGEPVACIPVLGTVSGIASSAQGKVAIAVALAAVIAMSAMADRLAAGAQDGDGKQGG